jgi:hypothetical protein
MLILRIIALTLPQLLILLPLGASMDLLGDWSHSDAGFNTLMLLFLMTPVVTLNLLIFEIFGYRKARRLLPERPSRFWIGVAIFLCAETLAINIALISQMRI